MASKPPSKTLNPTSSAIPAAKSQLYGATRPLYRPTAKPRGRSSRSPSCCVCFLLILLSLLLISAAAAAAFWFVYRPHRPSISVSALRISNSGLNLSLSVQNPNHRLPILYDGFSITVLSSGVPIASGTIPPFVQPEKNTTVLRSSLSGASIQLALKGKDGVPIEIRLETKARVEIGAMKTKRVRVRVSCDGIKASAPKKKKSESVADSSGSKCAVEFRVKIWKWQL